jgi:serine/threonine protein kinase
MAEARAKARQSFEKEAMVMHQHANHPNLLRLIGLMVDDTSLTHATSTAGGCLALVLEHCEWGSLFDALAVVRRSRSTNGQGQGQWQGLVDCMCNETQRAVIGADVGRGLAFLHGRTPSVLHRDVKSPNVLLTTNTTGGATLLCAKLADFGTARDHEQHAGGASMATVEVRTCTVVGTKAYMPPEYMQEGRLTPKVDSYALGVLLLELLTGLPPCFRRDDLQAELAAINVLAGESAEATGGGYREVLSSFVDTPLDASDQRPLAFAPYLDPLSFGRTPATADTADCTSTVWVRLLSISRRCLQMRRRERATVMAIMPELEALCVPMCDPPGTEGAFSHVATETIAAPSTEGGVALTTEAINRMSTEAIAENPSSSDAVGDERKEEEEDEGEGEEEGEEEGEGHQRTAPHMKEFERTVVHMEARAYLDLLAMAMADGTIDQAESEMLQKARGKYSITMTQHHEMTAQLRKDRPELAVQMVCGECSANVTPSHRFCMCCGEAVGTS